MSLKPGDVVKIRPRNGSGTRVRRVVDVHDKLVYICSEKAFAKAVSNNSNEKLDVRVVSMTHLARWLKTNDKPSIKTGT